MRRIEAGISSARRAGTGLVRRRSRAMARVSRMVRPWWPHLAAACAETARRPGQRLERMSSVPGVFLPGTGLLQFMPQEVVDHRVHVRRLLVVRTRAVAAFQ